MSSPATEILGPLCAFMSSVTWAIGSSGYSRLAREFTPFAVSFSRALVALPLFVAATFAASGGWSGGIEAYSGLALSNVGWFGLSVIASYGLGDAFFLWSVRTLGVPGALAIGSAYPVWTTAAGLIFWGEPVSPRQAAGMLIAVAGVIAVILSVPRDKVVRTGDGPFGLEAEGNRVGTGNGKSVGVALAILTSLFWALNNVAIARGGEGIAASVGNTVRMLISLGVTAALGACLAPKAPIVLPRRTLVASLWLFGLEAFGGSYFFVYGLTHSPLVLAATLSSLAPVLAVPVAWLMGLERVSWPRTAGVVITVLGLWLLAS